MDRSLKDKRRVAAKLQPTVRIGRSGLTSAVVEEVKAQLKNKEAVKIKILGTGREETKRLASEIVDRCVAELVDVRGNTVTLWRKKVGKDH